MTSSIPARLRLATSAAALALVAGLSPAAAQQAERFDLNALIAAAKTEKPITVYAVTGKIVETAKAFSEKYGLKATGKKVNEATQADLLVREARASNVIGDVSVAIDVSTAMTELLPQGIVESWVPPDIAPDVPEAMRKPLVIVTDPHVWTYNTAAYKTCPVTNIWQLTEPEWKGRVAMLDIYDKPLYADWFNQMATHHDAAMAKAYKDLYGKELKTTEASATAAWVKAYARNAPMMGDSGTVAEAAGAANQAKPFFALVSTAKYRDNLTANLKLGICRDLKPFAGFTYPGLGLIAKGTKSPATAKLFIHYLMTAEGIAPQIVDGKIPTNAKIAMPADEPSGVGGVLGQLMTFNATTAGDDADKRQDWQDFWRLNYKK
ncbi:ABC transporter substrate-binding protein [Bosea sp. MMO-172]|uniref:ABC transporter substrate-binding protein n=1 Tax=Bosea sp. MMO-172 TaxID=3127885 RepID=UPI0030175A05